MQRAVLIGLVALVALGCRVTIRGRRDSPPPPAGQVETPRAPDAASAAEASAPIANDVRLEVVRRVPVETETRPGQRVVRRYELRLANDGDRPIHYFGYSMDNPVFDRHRLVDGEWKNAIGGWCGTGLYRRELRPMEEVAFMVWVPEDEVPFRIALSLVDPLDPRTSRVVRVTGGEPR
ncbi:MAG: hypothetical protein AAF957_17310 [Planctomycetota bacterium]